MIYRRRLLARQVTLSDQRSFISEIANDYSRDRWQKKLSVRTHLEPLLKKVAVNPLLEIGAGAGVVLSLLQEMGYRAYGIEIVTTMIQAAKDRGVGGLIQADGVAMPFADGSFGFATLWGNTLGPIPGKENRIALLREARRVLAPDAPLAVTALNRTAGPRRLLLPLEFVFRYPREDGGRSEQHGYNRYYTIWQLKRELREAGFRRIKRISGMFEGTLVVLAKG